MAKSARACSSTATKAEERAEELSSDDAELEGCNLVVNSDHGVKDEESPEVDTLLVKRESTGNPKRRRF